MRYLSTDNLVELAGMLGCPEVRDLGLLDAAAHRPQASVFGEDAYRSLHEKAAALLESLVRNHAMVDGNKRLGWTSVTTFYRINGQHLVAPEDAAYDFVIAIAAGELETAEIASTLAQWVSFDSEQETPS